jgi:hypothetical protein
MYLPADQRKGRLAGSKRRREEREGAPDRGAPSRFVLRGSPLVVDETAQMSREEADTGQP